MTAREAYKDDCRLSRALTPLHNSFQRWAGNRCGAAGLPIEARGNWVQINVNGTWHECRSVKGVESICLAVLTGELA